MGTSEDEDGSGHRGMLADAGALITLLAQGQDSRMKVRVAQTPVSTTPHFLKFTLMSLPKILLHRFNIEPNEKTDFVSAVLN